MLNKLILKDFTANNNFSIDGLIVRSVKDLNSLKSEIIANKFEVVSFLNLNSFLEAEIKLSSFCFINMDDKDSIDEDTSLSLFRKVRGKIKVIMYNETKCNLKDEEFFKFINWMRLITID